MYNGFNGPYGRFGSDVAFMKSIIDYIIGDEYEHIPAQMLTEWNIREIASQISSSDEETWYAQAITPLIERAFGRFNGLFPPYSSMSKSDQDMMANDLCDRLISRLERYSNGRVLRSKRYANGPFILSLRWDD